MIEARWTKDGAACLHRPRIHVNPTSDSLAAFPDGPVLACSIPACEDLDVTNMDGAHLVSASPLSQ